MAYELTRQDYLEWAEEKVIERKILTAGVEALILGMKEIDIDKVTAIISVYKDVKAELDERILTYRKKAEELLLYNEGPKETKETEAKA